MAIIGTWAVKEIIHFFSPNLGRIPASEFKSDDGKSFAQMRFVFHSDGIYRVYGDVSCSDLRYEGTWYKEDGSYYYDPFIKDGLSPEQLEKVKSLRLHMGELTINLCLLVLFLQKEKDAAL